MVCNTKNGTLVHHNNMIDLLGKLVFFSIKKSFKLGTICAIKCENNKTVINITFLTFLIIYQIKLKFCVELLLVFIVRCTSVIF